MKNYLDLNKSKTFPYMRDVMIDTIFEHAKKDKDIYFITPDMGAPSLDEFRLKLPNQFIHSGICEQHMIAMSAGLSLKGKKVFCYAMAPFITSRCFEQIKCSLAAMEQPVTLIGIGVGLGYADAGPTHYTTEDICTMRSFPGIEIITPSDEHSTRSVAEYSIKNKKFRFLRLDRDALPQIYNDNIEFDIKKGFAEIVRGKETCIITSGYMLHKCISELNKNDKLNFGLIDLFKIKPINEEIISCIKKYKRIITIEEQCLEGGFGSAILEIINSNNLNILVKRFGLESRFYFDNGGRDYLLSKFGLNIKEIFNKKL